MQSDEIRVTVDPDDGPPEADDSLRARSGFEAAVRRAIGSTLALKTDQLTAQISEAYNKVTAAIESLPPTEHGCALESVSFTLAITSTGEVSLLSAVKGQAQGQAGLTFTVKRIP